MSDPKVINIEFIQKDLIRLTFDQLVRADKPSFTTLSNYAFTPLNGGGSIVVDSVVPDLNNPDAVTTSTAYVRFRGGTLGGTYAAIFQNIEGIAISNETLLSNGGFELGTGQTATNWSYTENVSVSGSFDFGPGRSRRMDASGYYTNQVGSRSFVLGDFNLLGGVDALIGDYCTAYSDPITVSPGNKLKLNLRWIPFIDGGPWYDFSIIVGGDTLVTHVATPVDLVDVEYTIPTASGSNNVFFRMNRINFNGPKTVATALFDNVRLVEQTSPTMVASENSFVLDTRTTKVDSLKAKFPRFYDLSIGSNLWTLLSALGLEDTRIGG